MKRITLLTSFLQLLLPDYFWLQYLTVSNLCWQGTDSVSVIGWRKISAGSGRDYSRTEHPENEGMNVWMNERRTNEWKCIYIGHKKLPHRILRVHSTRYTQCIHVSYRKLKKNKKLNYQRTLIPVRYKQPVSTHPFPKVQLYLVVKCRNIYSYK